MGKGISFWGVLVIVIIVGVISSLITVSITGNTVKSSETSSNVNAYTKAEIDSMFDSIKEDLTVEEEPETNFSCDMENLCEINELSAEGAIQSLSLSNPGSPLKTENAYVCVTKEGVLYRGTSVGCK